MDDLYCRWLGITSDKRPPAPNELLGVAPDEADAVVIRKAAVRQTNRVAPFRHGPDARACTRILKEIARAKRVMLNRIPPKPEVDGESHSQATRSRFWLITAVVAAAGLLIGAVLGAVGYAAIAPSAHGEPRYQMSVVENYTGSMWIVQVYRIDTWTGEVVRKRSIPGSINDPPLTLIPPVAPSSP